MSNGLDDKERRIKQQVAEVNESFDLIEGQSAYILVDGQKSGPYDKDQINQKLSEKSLLITDSFSIDGHEWFKLFQCAAFDRRSIQKEQLPGAPAEKLLNQEAPLSKLHEEKDAVANLAYLGHSASAKKQFKGSVGHQSDKITEELSKDEQTKKTASNKDSYLWGIAVFATVLGIVYVLFAPKDQAPQVAKRTQTSAKTAPAKKTKSNIKIKRSVASPPAFKKRSKAPRPSALRRKTKKVTSFTQSKAFKNRAKAKAKREEPVNRRDDREDENDDYYYDDGQAPVELDPVRSKIAKETFDPQNEDDDYYKDEDEDPVDREPASEDYDATDTDLDPEKAFEGLYE